MLKRKTPLQRKARLKRWNPERREAMHARNYGERANRVREMPCIKCKRSPRATKIVGVRAERLQDITTADIRAEGVDLSDIEGECPPDLDALARARWIHLWDSINGKRPGASWADNPWVWRIEFRRVRP